MKKTRSGNVNAMTQGSFDLPGEARAAHPLAREAKRVMERVPDLIPRLTMECLRAITRGTKRLNSDFFRWTLFDRFGLHVKHDHTPWLMRAVYRHAPQKLRAALPRACADCSSYEGLMP